MQITIKDKNKLQNTNTSPTTVSTNIKLTSIDVHELWNQTLSYTAFTCKWSNTCKDSNKNINWKRSFASGSKQIYRK